MIYLDASAVVTLVTGRPYAGELREFLAQLPEMPMGTSTIGFIETVRTLDRVGSYPTAMRDLLASFTEILVTDEIRDAAANLPGGLRTPDAVHVASAQAIGDALAYLVTYDKRMLDIAHSAGLPVAAPGLSS
ncbi:MAG: type II toxin-antitoxin system VapC family toxin [Streptosporangiaceae bacterium]